MSKNILRFDEYIAQVYPKVSGDQVDFTPHEDDSYDEDGYFIGAETDEDEAVDEEFNIDSDDQAFLGSRLKTSRYRGRSPHYDQVMKELKKKTAGGKGKEEFEKEMQKRGFNKEKNSFDAPPKGGGIFSGIAARAKKLGQKINKEVWKGYKKPLYGFWDQVYDIVYNGKG